MTLTTLLIVAVLLSMGVLFTRWKGHRSRSLRRQRRREHNERIQKTWDEWQATRAAVARGDPAPGG